ncbi:hypothetical protein SUGI_0694190 [Cryptomeria japonica]|nr:hypothetical protein SUGI_0694190 [Cryptomeria japonica]
MSPVTENMVVTDCKSESKMMEKYSLKCTETGCFVLWQMMPNMWLVEMALGDSEVHAASSVKIMWQHTPWLVSHLTKGPVRLLPHTLKGMDPVSIARLFANGRCIGEHIIGEEVDLYICGKLFVLRELYQPVDTLKHVGIKGHVVEHMEARLKEEILSEIA